MNRWRTWLSCKTNKNNSYTANLTSTTRSLPEADKWAQSEFVLHNLVPLVSIHPFPLDEMLLMCSTVAYFEPDIIIEWGTHYGKSARIFYEVVKYLKFGTKIHSIDLPLDVVHVENIHDVSQRGKFVRGTSVALHLGDGLTVAGDILKSQKTALPLFFIDGDHSFESVYNELNGIRELTSHAVILAHDTFLQGAESGYNCGPYEAISKFTAQHQLPLLSTILGLPGMSLTYWL